MDKITSKEIFGLISQYCTLKDIEHWSICSKRYLVELKTSAVYIQRLLRYSHRYEQVLSYQLQREHKVFWNGEYMTKDRLQHVFKQWIEDVHQQSQVCILPDMSNVSTKSKTGTWVYILQCFPLRKVRFFIPPTFYERNDSKMKPIKREEGT